MVAVVPLMIRDEYDGETAGQPHLDSVLLQDTLGAVSVLVEDESRSLKPSPRPRPRARARTPINTAAPITAATIMTIVVVADPDAASGAVSGSAR